MHHNSQLERLIANRIRSRLGEAEASALAHRARVDSRAARTRAKAGSKKLWLPDSHLTVTRTRCDTPDIRLQRSAS
jgi:hypothetical protein